MPRETRNLSSLLTVDLPAVVLGKHHMLTKSPNRRDGPAASCTGRVLSRADFLALVVSRSNAVIPRETVAKPAAAGPTKASA